VQGLSTVVAKILEKTARVKVVITFGLRQNDISLASKYLAVIPP
jgi:hypothetical protein